MEPEAPEMPTMIRLGTCAMRPPARHGTPADWLGWARMAGGGASAAPDARGAGRGRHGGGAATHGVGGGPGEDRGRDGRRLRGGPSGWAARSRRPRGGRAEEG